MGKTRQKKRKPGRPKLPKGTAKGKIVPIRFTKAEAEQLAEAAKANDQTLSEWIRQAVLGAISALREPFRLGARVRDMQTWNRLRVGLPEI